jgi:signal transduction histidine kinase
MSSTKPPASAVGSPAAAALAEFLSRNRERAITEWERAVRAIPASAMLDRAELRDHMPALIDRLLELVETPDPRPTDELAARHAIERMKEGYNLEQVAWEYSALRGTLLRLNQEAEDPLGAEALVLLNDAIDRAVVHAITRYHRARVNTLEALDRIAREGLLAEPQPLDALLHRLLTVIVDSTAAADTAVLFLNESDRLVARAAAGLEQEIEGRFSLAIGEGFAGRVAATRAPLFTHSAETDPLVRNPLLRMHGVKALYGVPLLHGDEIVGVAKMGSRTATDFAAEERLLLRSIANRAAAFIAQKRAAEDREILLHILGHDLRSPLNTIAIAGQMLAMSTDHSPEEAQHVDRLVAAAERMGRLIADITDFTQTRVTGAVPLQTEPIDLGDMVDQIAREIRARGEREIRIERAGDATGEWDRGRMLRVIANLLENALAYGDPASPVTVGVRGADGEVVLSVHNAGAPIPANLRPRLFEAFKRGDKGVGSGLGLFIVQKIVHAHGGRVDLDSAAGRGTTFSVRLPRRPASEARS